MKFKAFIAVILFLFYLLPGVSFAQNKVVVIPLTETVEAPLEPYAPLAAASPPISAYTIGTTVVADNVTGLSWKRTVAFGMSWDEAWDYCQSQTTGRKSDWRLPSIIELVSIVDYGATDPAFNSAVFPGFGTLSTGNCWSETTQAFDGNSAWNTNIGTGFPSIHDKLSENCVVCVRGKFFCCGNFKNNGNGTVTDLATGLTWQHQDDDFDRNWVDANDYCQEMSLGGNQDWRLPSIKELQSIVDYRNDSPSISPTFFPGTNPTTYWSETPAAWLSDLALLVDFQRGYVIAGQMSASKAYVRCVR